MYLPRNLARENPRQCLGAGLIATEGTQSYLGTDFEKGLVAKTPLGRIGQPGDIASVAVFLASDDFRLDDWRATHRKRWPSLIFVESFVSAGQLSGERSKRRRQKNPRSLATGAAGPRFALCQWKVEILTIRLASPR